jgi:hypothetical protein
MDNEKIAKELIYVAQELASSNVKTSSDSYIKQVAELMQDKTSHYKEIEDKYSRLERFFKKELLDYYVSYIKKEVKNPEFIFLGSLDYNIEESLSKKYLGKTYPGFITKLRDVAPFGKSISSKTLIKNAYIKVFGRDVWESILNKDKSKKLSHKVAIGYQMQTMLSGNLLGPGVPDGTGLNSDDCPNRDKSASLRKASLKWFYVLQGRNASILVNDTVGQNIITLKECKEIFGNIEIEVSQMIRKLSRNKYNFNFYSIDPFLQIRGTRLMIQGRIKMDGIVDEDLATEYLESQGIVRF